MTQGTTQWFADYTGKCFEKSAKEGYDSEQFAKEWLNSPWGIALLTEQRIKEYESMPYMYAKAKRNLRLKKGRAYDPYIMWMYGYLVKYWVNKENKSPGEIWETLPVDMFEKRFGKYHTQGWDYIIQDAEKSKK